jgi:hypothetical protein
MPFRDWSEVRRQVVDRILSEADVRQLAAELSVSALTTARRMSCRRPCNQ